MNAKNSSIVKASLALTSLVVCGAFAIFATSCASSSDNGGGGSSGGGTPAGGSGGGSIGPTGGSVAPGGDTVTFTNGKAQGPMTGYAFVALGAQNTITDPTCNPSAGTDAATQQITKATPCPNTGQTVWNAADALCMSGTIPKVTTPAGSTSPDYTSDWGLQIGVNTSNPPGTTLGTTYSTVALTINPAAVTPTNSAIRAGVHLVSMAVDANPYCATITASGAPIPLTNFNTECWAGTTCAATSTTCLQLKATDVPNIDKVLVQISSDTTNAYTVSGFCLQSIAFAK